MTDEKKPDLMPEEQQRKRHRARIILCGLLPLIGSFDELFEDDPEWDALMNGADEKGGER